MGVLVAGVVLAVTLSLLNILLLFAVLRRLREYGEKLPAPQSMFERDNDLNGKRVPEFTSSTVEGTTITRDDLTGRHTIVGFFAAGCKPCHEHAPDFAHLDGHTYAFISGEGPDADVLKGLLQGSTAVVAGDVDLERALGVTSFPTFLLVDETGTVERATISLRDLQLSRA